MENSTGIQVFQLQTQRVSCRFDLEHLGIPYRNTLYTSFHSSSLADFVENELRKENYKMVTLPRFQRRELGITGCIYSGLHL